MSKRKDGRIVIAPIGEYYEDLLALSAWASGQSKSMQGSALLRQKLDEIKASIDDAIAQAAKKRGLSPDEVRAKILAGEEI